MANRQPAGGDGTTLEWAAIAPGRIVVAGPGGAWLHEPGAPGDPFARPMAGRGTPETTRRLLDAALWDGAGTSGAAPALTRELYAWKLAGAWHTARATPRLLRAAAARLRALGRHDLAGCTARKAREETGHERLALDDLAALGLDAAHVVMRLRPPRALALVALFEALVAADGVGFLGYEYALERAAAGIGADTLRALEAVAPGATRCIALHSGCGADAAHADAAARLVASLAAPERAAVAAAVWRTARLMTQPIPGDPPDPGFLRDALAACRRDVHHDAHHRGEGT